MPCVLSQAALDSSRYVDDEVEGLLCANGGARFELDHFLSPPPELAEGWWGTGNTKILPAHARNRMRHATPTERVNATSQRLAVTARAVLGNIPSRGRGCTGGDIEHRDATYPSPIASIVSTELQPNEHGVRAHKPSRAGTGVGTGRSVDKVPKADCNQADAPRGKGGISAPSNGSVGHREEQCGQVKGEVRGSAGGGGSREEGGDGRDGGAANQGGNDLVKAWGLKDPRVVRAMMKRRKRMRKFQTGEVSQ